MTQMSKHGQLAQEYWETYRPQALAELEDRERFFHTLDLRVADRIGELTEELLKPLLVEERAQARRAVRQQAAEIVYDEEIYLPKEEGTEHREM